MQDAPLPYRDRRHAGRVLAERLEHLRGRPGLLVLALPRGGVPVGFEVARSLQVPLDVVVVRKIGMPGRPEYAIGAIAACPGGPAGGVRLMRPLPGMALQPDQVRAVVAREEAELVRREQAYRGGRPAASIEGRSVIVVDDGVATGATLLAALAALRRQHPLELIVALPVGPAESCGLLRGSADEVVCAAQPATFHAVGEAYLDFDQVGDAEVNALLDRSGAAR